MKKVAAVIIVASIFLGACEHDEVRYNAPYVGHPMTDEEQFDLNIELQNCYSIRNAQC